MRLRISIEAEVSEDIVARMREWQDEHRQVMIDPGGDEPGIIGRFVGATPIEGKLVEPWSQL